MSAPSPARQPALAFIFFTVVLAVLGFSLIIPVLPGLVTQFKGGSVAEGSHAYGLLIGVFALMQFVASPVLGALSDRFGRRKVILFALAGSAIDYVVMANAPTLAWLFVARVIAGITAGVLSTANAYVADVSAPEKRAQAFGLIGAAFGIGFALGPTLGGWLGHYDLRAPFWAAAACTAANWLYGYFVLPESLAPQNRRAFSWKRANPIGALAALQRFPTVLRLAGTYFILMLAQTMLQSTWVLYTSNRYGWGPGQVGLSLTLAGVVSAIVQAGLIKPILAQLGDARGVIAGFLISMTAQTLYGFASAGWMIYAIIPLGAFGSIAGPALQSYITKHVPANEQGAVQGVYSGLASLAGIPGPLVAAWSFGWAFAPGNPWHVPGIAFFEAATLMLLALALTLRSFQRDAHTPVKT